MKSSMRQTCLDQRRSADDQIIQHGIRLMAQIIAKEIRHKACSVGADEVKAFSGFKIEGNDVE